MEAVGLKFELCWSGTSCSRQGPDATQCLEHPWFSGYSEVGKLWKMLNFGVSEWKVDLCSSLRLKHSALPGSSGAGCKRTSLNTFWRCRPHCPSECCSVRSPYFKGYTKTKEEKERGTHWRYSCCHQICKVSKLGGVLSWGRVLCTNDWVAEGGGSSRITMLGLSSHIVHL